uniref:Uncharacterized protein n=1 Tax=Amphora coffeiformis TaxID=265554 RepID=A0A7S3L363_9STRA|eukprot:scaffold3221_cov194-Amphora_coffeaeformis.AAC.5
MKHLISSAISLTNQGTDKLATGEYFAAASAFCRAIKITQLLSEQAAKNKKAAASSIAATLSYEALPVLLADVSCNNEIAIFEHCFIVVLKHDVDDDDSSSSSSLLWTKETVTTQQCQVFTAALIYNLALTYHYGGVCGNSRERMNDALQLYAKAIDFLPDPTKDDDDDDEEEEEDTRDGRALRLALCNNAASLSLVLSDDSMYQTFCTRIHQELAAKGVDDTLDVSFYLRNLAMWQHQMKTTRRGNLHRRLDYHRSPYHNAITNIH